MPAEQFDGPAPQANQRCAEIAIAGHTGDAATARSALADPTAEVRAVAVRSLIRLGQATLADLEACFGDDSPRVRARAAELSHLVDGGDPTRLLNDPVDQVVEVAAFACGEIHWSTSPPIIELSQIAVSHHDPLCRESAAAALGAIGDPAGLDAVLAACSDRVTVRRRATLALAAFDDPRAEAQLHVSLEDKDWQVRQAAEDLLEVGRVLERPADPGAYAE